MHIPDEVLLHVKKPARYIGNEINMVVKEADAARINFAFCFPDVYEVGMSHLGLQILYFFLNRRDDVYCQRAFAPWLDMEEILRERGLPLFSLETWTPLIEFDFVAFTLQYELSYTNVLNMLSLSNIPFLATQRTEEHPIICAGGPCAYNPEPLADFIDFFCIGEGEAILDEVLDIYNENKKQGGSKKDFLMSLLNVEGVYVPQFYDPNKTPVINKAIVCDVDASFYPEKPLVPLVDVVQNRAMLEVFRGCVRGCRFCQAGFVCRPYREKKCSTLLKQAEAVLASTGHQEISLLSLSTGDYKDFPALAEQLLGTCANQNVNISLPSLRIDAFSLGLMEKIQTMRKSSLTFAPEAGTQRLRDVINKGINEAEIMNGCRLAFQGGWDRIKLYFMVGLPTETEEDLKGIVSLAESIVEVYYATVKKNRPVKVVASVSCFVPKPLTPFQWEAQDSYEKFVEKQQFLKNKFRKWQVSYHYHDAGSSVLEGALARGDKQLGTVIAKAWELGARFDGWSEHFKFDLWKQAFEELGVDMASYNRQRSITEPLPWEHISAKVSKETLIRERERALGGEGIFGS